MVEIPNNVKALIDSINFNNSNENTILEICTMIYNLGLTKGYINGSDEGYNEGYNSGWDDCNDNN